MTLKPGESVSLGTWGNKEGHDGIWYNLEACGGPNAYKDDVSLQMNLNADDIGNMNNFIADNDKWTAGENCAAFAAGLWNSVSDNKLSPQSWYGVCNPSGLAASIESNTGSVTGRTFAKATYYGYKKGSNLYIPPNGSSGMITSKSSSDSSSLTSKESSSSWRMQPGSINPNSSSLGRTKSSRMNSRQLSVGSSSKRSSR